MGEIAFSGRAQQFQYDMLSPENMVRIFRINVAEGVIGDHIRNNSPVPEWTQTGNHMVPTQRGMSVPAFWVGPQEKCGAGRKGDRESNGS